MIALLPTWNYLRDHAIPRICSSESAIVAKCDHEGSNSLSKLARKMQASDVSAQRAKREDAARQHDTAGEVS